MRRILVICLLTLLSLTNLAAARQSSYLMQGNLPVTLEEYWELVRNTRQAIVQLEAEPEQSIHQQLDALSLQWAAITEVELPDKNLVPIDSSFLVAELKSDPPNLAYLQNLLDTYLQAHAQYPQNVFSLQDVQPLNEILARPEFQWQQAPTSETPSWLQNLFDRFADFLNRLSHGTEKAYYYGRVPLIVAATLLFLLSLFYISRSLSRSLVREAQLAAEGGESDELLTSKGALQRAQTLSGEGDYRNAIRYLYLSSLLVLDEEGLLRYDRSRTNREYLRSVSSRPELANPLQEVIDVFDRVWYGYESVDEETYQSYVEHVEELREKKE